MATRSTFLKGADAATPCRWLLLAFALCLLQAQEGRAQSLSVRIDEHEGDSVNRLQSGSTFYVLRGKKLSLNCFCSGYESVELYHNGVRVQTSECHRLLYRINMTDQFDQGIYTCLAHTADGSNVTALVGNLTVVDASVVQASTTQYGFFRTETLLNCSTTLDAIEFGVVFNWYYRRREGETEQKLPGRPQFESTDVSHEGVYTCELFISAIDIKINTTITFKVIVPPRIFHENEHIVFEGNQRQDITVSFQSRSMDYTNVTWWKNEVPLLPETAADIRTVETTPPVMTKPPNSTTTLRFNPTRRADTGEYRLSVENRFYLIPLNRRRDEVVINVQVIVPPAQPIEVATALDRVSWTLPDDISDDARADSFTVTLNFTHNGTLAQQFDVMGGARWAELEVVPGMNYTVLVTAHNQDGSRSSELHQFATPNGPPPTPSIQVKRVSNSSLELVVSLSYTGGGDITHFDVSFRELGTKAWIAIGRHVAQSMAEMTWKSLVYDERFAGIAVELQVAVINTPGSMSLPVVLIEPIDAPSAPELESITKSTDTLIIQVTLSTFGTPPILALVVNFTAPEVFTRNFSGPFVPGETYDLQVGGLRDNTQYSFTLLAVNYQGRGVATPTYHSTTAKLPPIPSYGIILLALSAAVLLFLIILFIVIAFVMKRRQHRQKKTYTFNHRDNMTLSSEGKELDHTNAMVSRGSNSYTQHNPSLPSSRSILSNGTTSSSYLATSPPPFSPGGCSVSTSNTGPTSILRISDPTTIERYRYETCSSTTSNSVQSDESDAGIRYTYNISPSPPVEIDTPELRANSTYSVMTTTTRMTSSSTSTRESLTYPHESNATVV